MNTPTETRAPRTLRVAIIAGLAAAALAAAGFATAAQGAQSPDPSQTGGGAGHSAKWVAR